MSSEPRFASSPAAPGTDRADRADAADPADPAELRGRYLDLLRDALTFNLWDGRDGSMWRDGSLTRKAVRVALSRRRLELTRKLPPEWRAEGRDWPRLAHTMIGLRRMDNLRSCVERVLAAGVPGDLIETGVWRGGACIFMRGVLAAHGVTDRTVWVADSFAGLPAPDAGKYAADARDQHHRYTALAVPMEEVRENFRRYGMLDDQVRFLKGWFRDTLPTAPIERLAVLRLDGDMYESTSDALHALYGKLSKGGFCVVDDYGNIDGCRQAVDDFRAAQGITEPITRIDWTGAYWRKGTPATARTDGTGAGVAATGVTATGVTDARVTDAGVAGAAAR